MDAGARDCIDREIERLAGAKPRQREVGDVEARFQGCQIRQRKRGAARGCECPDFSASLEQDRVKGRSQFCVAQRDLRLTHLRSCRLPAFDRGYYPRFGGVDRGFRDIQLRLAGVICGFGDAFLLPECGYAREVEFRLRQARLCLNQLRLGGAHTSVAFFLRATRLVNNSLIVARTDTREYGPTDDGRAWP